jgi:uncharacterized membrane protein YgcG
MDCYGTFARRLHGAKPAHLYHHSTLLHSQMPLSLASWSVAHLQHPAPSPSNIRATWRSPGRLFGQAQPVRPLLLCFAGLQAANSATEARPLLGKRTASSQSGGDAEHPTTVEELAEVVAANTPVFYLHPRERFYPCTVEWFLQHARLAVMRNILLRRKVERVLVPYGELDAASLRRAYEADPKQRLQLQLRKQARPGQKEALEHIPCYAHVRETIDNTGKRDALEIVYMKFFAYNGPYRPFGVIPTRTLGAHDSDWEHVTVRLTPDGREVTGVYYSCHRHIDGTWRSADEVPRTPEGRPEAFVAINGHGSYPHPGRIIRLFGAFNDHASRRGAVWAPRSCVLVTPGGKLPSVESRGDDLNGTAYPSMEAADAFRNGDSNNGSSGCSSFDAGDSSTTGSSSGSNSSGGGGSGSMDVFVAGSPIAAARSVTLRHDPGPEWLYYGGKWGSTVQAPALQEWFAGAENPVSRTWLQTVFFPLVPGVPTLLEPVEEQVEDATDYVSQQVEDAQRSIEEKRTHAQQSLEQYQKALMERFDELLSTSHDKEREPKDDSQEGVKPSKHGHDSSRDVSKRKQP